jgi:hypothetical protein
MSGISQIFGTGETCKTGSGNGNTHAAGPKMKPTLKGSDPASLWMASSSP